MPCHHRLGMPLNASTHTSMCMQQHQRSISATAFRLLPLPAPHPTSQATCPPPLHPGPLRTQVLRSGNSTSRTAELLPTVTRVVDVVAAAPGRWPFYCDVHDHLLAGMQGTLVVTD